MCHGPCPELRLLAWPESGSVAGAGVLFKVICLHFFPYNPFLRFQKAKKNPKPAVSDTPLHHCSASWIPADFNGIGRLDTFREKIPSMVVRFRFSKWTVGEEEDTREPSFSDISICQRENSRSNVCVCMCVRVLGVSLPPADSGHYLDISGCHNWGHLLADWTHSEALEVELHDKGSLGPWWTMHRTALPQEHCYWSSREWEISCDCRFICFSS